MLRSVVVVRLKGTISCYKESSVCRGVGGGSVRSGRQGSFVYGVDSQTSGGTCMASPINQPTHKTRPHPPIKSLNIYYTHIHTWRASLHTRLLCALGLNIRRVLQFVCVCVCVGGVGWSVSQRRPNDVDRTDCRRGRDGRRWSPRPVESTRPNLRDPSPLLPTLMD